MSSCSSSSDEFWEDQWLGQGRVEGEEVADHPPQHLRGEAGGEEGGEGRIQKGKRGRKDESTAYGF